jgi:hypothetical protein
MLHGQPSVLTWHNDNARTGQNLQETTLTPATVASSAFQKLFVIGVDGKVDAQPLYVPSVAIPGQGIHNTLYVVTENDSAYAFDADTGVQLWRVSLLGSGETPSDDRGCSQVTPQIGITSTPVIDPQMGPNGAMYAIAMSKTAGTYLQRLHALDLTNGSELFGGPVEIQATYPGSGAEGSGTLLTFDPAQHKERAALIILNNVVYTAWSSHCDIPPYTGWVIGYNETTLAQVSLLNLTPNGSDGGMWGAGSGPAADSAGNLYLLMGNGTFDTTLNSAGLPENGDYGNGFVKLSTSGNLAVADYFTMWNTVSESGSDADLGSGGAMVLPPLTDANGHTRMLAVGAGKDEHIYVVDRNNMGKFLPGANAIYEELPSSLSGGVWSSPAWFNGNLYYGAVGDQLKQFGFSGGAFGANPLSLSPTGFGYPGTTPSISANGTSNGIVWAAENTDPAVLHAYDAADLSTELYNSNSAANGRDRFGTGNKFIVPTVVNGKVYVATTSGVGVFGIVAPPNVHIDSPDNGASVSGTVTVSGWAIDNATTVGTAIGSVQMLVDGTAAGTATYGVSRPDVCTAYPGRPGCPNVGFTYSLNAAALTAGSHTVTVTATDSDSPPNTGSASLTVIAGGTAAVIPSVHIDSPAQGAAVSGTVTVSGWAIDNASAVGTAISGAKVLVDGTPAGNATYGVSRPDVCAAYPGRPGCPNVGFSYSLNTATLAAGSHTITVSATDSASPPHTGSASVTVTVGAAAVIPSVHIDSPAQGSAVSATVTVAGWAIDNPATVGTAISSVKVLVDGTPAGNATYGVSRPDVCAAYPGRPGCPNVGFSYSLNTATLAAGSHTITVTAADSASPPDTGSASVTVTVGAAAVIPSVHIDLPASGATVSGTVTVSGWAIDNASAVGTAISSVKVLVDGTPAGNATYGVSRPDVCAAYPGRPGCPNVGFSYSLNTATLAAGSHTITVTATDSAGPPDTGSANVTVTAAATAVVIPAVHIDLPAPGATVSGTVTVAGWAIDNASTVGTAISGVQVLVDGTPAGAATYGANRPDVCAAYPGRPGCPNVGYSYSLDTTTLAAGSHIIAVTATDSASPPDTGSTTITVQK